MALDFNDFRLMAGKNLVILKYLTFWKIRIFAARRAI